MPEVGNDCEDIIFPGNLRGLDGSINRANSLHYTRRGRIAKRIGLKDRDGDAEGCQKIGSTVIQRERDIYANEPEGISCTGLAFGSWTWTTRSRMALRRYVQCFMEVGEPLPLVHRVHRSVLTQFDVCVRSPPGGWVADRLKFHVGDRPTRRYIRINAKAEWTRPVGGL